MQNTDHITALAKHFTDDFLKICERKTCSGPTSRNQVAVIKDIEIQLFEKHVNEKVKGEIFRFSVDSLIFVIAY
jgi:hypothetical protein